MSSVMFSAVPLAEIQCHKSFLGAAHQSQQHARLYILFLFGAQRGDGMRSFLRAVKGFLLVQSRVPGLLHS